MDRLGGEPAAALAIAMARLDAIIKAGKVLRHALARHAYDSAMDIGRRNPLPRLFESAWFPERPWYEDVDPSNHAPPPARDRPIHIL